jgi:hypothetical protein
MATLFEETVPIALASGAAPEFYYLASEYSDDVQTARIEGPRVIEFRYFLDSDGRSLSGSTVTLDPAKGDYLRFGGSLVAIDMVNPWGAEILGEVYPRKTDAELLEECDGGKDCETKRWRGPNTQERQVDVTFTSTGCVRGDLIQGSNCQAVDNLPSLQSVSMPQLTLQSDGVEYTYDWAEWASYTEIDVSEDYLTRTTGYNETQTNEPLPLDTFYSANNVIARGAGGRGYGYTDADRQATNGAGLYEDTAKLKITVTEGADLSWLLWVAATLVGAGIIKRSL